MDDDALGLLYDPQVAGIGPESVLGLGGRVACPGGLVAVRDDQGLRPIFVPAPAHLEERQDVAEIEIVEDDNPGIPLDEREHVVVELGVADLVEDSVVGVRVGLEGLDVAHRPGVLASHQRAVVLRHDDVDLVGGRELR